MTRWSKLCRAVLAVMSAAVLAPIGAARAQATEASIRPSRYTVEVYLAQYSVETEASDRTGLGGIGARVMFGRADPTKLLRTFFSRARAGAFITYTTKQKADDISTTHIGGQADVPLLAAPIRNIFDPFVSLGAGVFHSSVAGVTAGTNTTSNDFALTPAAGTIVPITGAISFRGDLRDVIIFGQSKTTNNFVAEGGISLGF